MAPATRLRVLIGAVGWPGHLFPALAVGRELLARGHEVTIETSARWRAQVEGLGMRLLAEPERVRFDPEPGDGAGASKPIPLLSEAARELVPAIRELAPDVALHDLYSLIPALAADAAGIPRATMMPHPFPEPAAAEPPYSWGLMPPRTRLGAALWRRTRERVETRRRVARRGGLERHRAALGLEGMGDQNMMLSPALTMVATFPQLEYPRRWPSHMRVTGPPIFELEHPDVELPAGGEPLVLVAASTRQDPELRLLGATLEALAEEPVRVLATTNRPSRGWEGEVPANASVVDWVSYSQVLPEAALVICRGGHGTIARALAAGVPLLVSPWAGDMAENATRVAWSGAGMMLPRRLAAPASIRWAVRRLLADPRSRRRAEEIAAWARKHDPAATIAGLLERFAAAAGGR